MNNDLSKLSDNELSKKIEDLNKGADMVAEHRAAVINEHNLLLRKKRVKPRDLLRVQKHMDELTIAVEMLEEYNKTLIEEQNRRMEEVEEKVEEESNPYDGPVEKYRKAIVEQCRGMFGAYNEMYVTKGIEIAERFYPNKKLQAIKDFKELTREGLKESKAFMDMCWEEISYAHSIKGPIG